MSEKKKKLREFFDVICVVAEVEGWRAPHIYLLIPWIEFLQVSQITRTTFGDKNTKMRNTQTQKKN